MKMLESGRAYHSLATYPGQHFTLVMLWAGTDPQISMTVWLLANKDIKPSLGTSGGLDEGKGVEGCPLTKPNQPG
jgi:hypothetical protein